MTALLEPNDGEAAAPIELFATCRRRDLEDGISFMNRVLCSADPAWLKEISNGRYDAYLDAIDRLIEARDR